MLILLELRFWHLLILLFVAGEQWGRRRISSSGPWSRASCCLLPSNASPLSPSPCRPCLPASVCLSTLPHTLHLLAHGREPHVICKRFNGEENGQRAVAEQFIWLGSIFHTWNTGFVFVYEHVRVHQLKVVLWVWENWLIQVTSQITVWCCGTVNLRFICISKQLWASFCYLGVTLPSCTLLLVALQSYHAF